MITGGGAQKDDHARTQGEGGHLPASRGQRPQTEPALPTLLIFDLKPPKLYVNMFLPFKPPRLCRSVMAA